MHAEYHYRILMIEDHPAEAELVQSMLEAVQRFSFSITVVDTLGAGLRLLQSGSAEERHYDLVLLDLNLPDSNGFATFEALNEHASWIAVIILTNQVDEALGLRATRQGAQDYLVKTELDSRLLVHAIRYAVERKHVEEQILYDAFHDRLTGLPNRALFIDRLNHAILQSRRRCEQTFAVLNLDLDRFKLLNDSLGYTASDRLLAQVGKRLLGCVRAGDTVARLGGDEFIILLEDIDGISDATMIAERIHNALQTPFEINHQRVVTSASMGIVVSDPAYESAEVILQDAEIAMYEAKMRGKACHVIFTPSMRALAVARLDLEIDLRQVLGNEERCNRELFILFQPIISLENGRITGFEALLRWNHPRRGLIEPNEFIPIAEETGLIHRLGLWVLRRSCEQVKRWRAMIPLSAQSLPLAINVNFSRKQFARPDLVDEIHQILLENQVDPQSINLEITESLFMEGEGLYTDKLEKIRQLGVKLQVDDFGRGYSSYGYLQNYPVDTLKIDSLFIHRLGKEGANSEIVRSILGLGRSLGLTVIAEGVETESQLRTLKELDCPFGQGYFLSVPVSAEQAGQMLVQNWAAMNGNGTTLIQ